MQLEPADVIYVNAGAARPMNTWLDAMKDGGRLVLPLTTPIPSGPVRGTKGAIFLISRRGDEYFAQWKCETGIYPCHGASDDVSSAALASAFEKEGCQKVTRLYRTTDIDEERCWLRGEGWTLAYS